MSHKRRNLILSLLFFVAIASVPSWVIYRQVHQNRLNKALISAVKRSDDVAVIRLLAAGAEADAQDLPANGPSPWQMFLDRLRGKSKPTAKAPTALLVALTKVSNPLETKDTPVKVSIIKTLLDKGANIDAQDNKGNTPLYLSLCWVPYTNVTHLLLQAGANVNIANNDGDTPLLLELGGGHDEKLAKALLDKTVDVNYKGQDGYTALIWAAQSGNMPVLKILLDRGAEVNVATQDGYTPLILAALNDHVSILRLLLQHGANTKARCCTGDSVLSWAIKNSEKEAVRFLRNAGVRE